jgi:TolB-like protein/class 3 adenylate cyclase/Tfp pilus assembly protein PilF
MSAPSQLDRRLAAVWFADVVGFTSLADSDEDAALEAVGEFQAAARVAVEGRGGRVVKFLGDGALAEFASARAALEAALELCASFSGSGAPGATAIRIGLHVGEVAGTPDGDVYGDGVNLAARLQSVAAPGEVVVSEDAARALRHSKGFRFDPIGDRDLKGYEQPTRVYRAVPAEAGAGRARGGPASGAASGATPAQRSIAVLPFANLSRDPADEYFSDGVTEEILTSLARIEGLKVISRTSVMRYKGTSAGVREIARELGVASILEGSVRHAGARVRITAQLIDATTDAHLWAERYDRDLEDIFAIQTDVAERIVEALKVKLSPGEKARLAAAPTSLPGYQEYLRGLWFLNRRTPEDLRRAIDHFEHAIASDPGYAPAHAGVASACVLQLHWGREAGAVDPARAVAEAERALKLDPDCAEACAARGMIRIYRRDWSGAEESFRCALECNPGDATARQWYAHFLAAMGRFDEAFEQISQARELDPLSLVVITEAGNVHFMARRFDVAIRLYREALDLDPTFRAPHYKLMEISVITQRHAEALAELEWLGYLDRERADATRRALAEGDVAPYFEALRTIGEDSGWPLTFVGWNRLWRGDSEGALEVLDRAVVENDWYLIRLPLAPHWDPVRDDSRFQAILERIGLDRVPRPDPATWLPGP